MRTIVSVIAFAMFAASAVGKDISVPPRSASLQEQKMCAEQADKKFLGLDEYKPIQKQPDVLEDIEHTNHFEAGVCYLTAYVIRTRNVADTGDTSAVLLQQSEVIDAFEGRRYANFLYLGQNRKYSETEPVDCRVKPRGQSEIKCSSWAEYQDLIEKYFGIGR